MLQKSLKKALFLLLISGTLMASSGCSADTEKLKVQAEYWVDQAATYIVNLSDLIKSKTKKSEANTNQLPVEKLKNLAEEMKGYRETLVGIITQKDEEAFKNELLDDKVEYDFKRITKFFDTQPKPLVINVLADGTGNITFKNSNERCIFIVKKVKDKFKITKIYFKK